MKFINIETEESQESTQQTINYSRSDYINIDQPYDDLYLMDTVATDSFDNEPKKIELINPINIQGLDKCYQSQQYFTIDNLFSELQTSVQKEQARKNLGINLDTISVQGDIKLGVLNLSQLSNVKQAQSELTETNQIAYFIITDNSGKLPSKQTAYSVPTNVVRQLQFASPNPTAQALLNIVASKVSFSPIGVNVGDLIALTRIKVKVSDLTNVIGITIPGATEIELYQYKILATNDAKPYNYNGITQGVMGLMSPWDKTEVNKISGIENIANAALPRIDYLPSKWENNMNNCLETGVYPWCTLGRPAGSTGAYTCISIKSSTNDGNYYTIEQTAYGRQNELGQIYKRIIFYKKDGTDTQYHDWINISDSFKTNYYTKDESVELFAKKTSVESNNEKISKILSGETPVEKANKLTNKRTISLSGYAVSNTPYFDGSSDVKISINSINDRSLQLGQSIKNGDYYQAKMTPIDTANLEFSTNRLAFNKPECITIEYSNDGGSTWLDYEATDIQKIGFISGIGSSFFLGKNTSAQTANQDMLRIKINHDRGAYTNMQRLYIYLTTEGAMVDNSSALLCKVEKSLCKDPENLSLVGNYLVTGWPGWNSINIGGNFGRVSNTNIHTIQLTFSFNGYLPEYTSKTKAKIMKLQMLGSTVFTNSTGCQLLQTGHLYNYDQYKNATFPAKVTSTILESNIETGTAPIKVKSTTKVSNLKSEYSEKDVNGNVIHTTYATKSEVENEINRSEKIVRKEDIVNNLTDGGADKALSAEMGKELDFRTLTMQGVRNPHIFKDSEVLFEIDYSLIEQEGVIDDGKVVLEANYYHTSPIALTKGDVLVVFCNSPSPFWETDENGSFYKDLGYSPVQSSATQYYKHIATKDCYVALSYFKTTDAIPVKGGSAIRAYKYKSPTEVYIKSLIEHNSSLIERNSLLISNIGSKQVASQVVANTKNIQVPFNSSEIAVKITSAPSGRLIIAVRDVAGEVIRLQDNAEVGKLYIFELSVEYTSVLVQNFTGTEGDIEVELLDGYILNLAKDINDLSVNLTKDINDLSKEVDTINESYTDVQPTNLFNSNGSDIRLGEYINSEGNTKTTSSYNITGYIPVEVGKTYYFGKDGTPASARTLEFYDSNKKTIANSFVSSAATATAPSNAVYLRCSVAVSVWDLFQVNVDKLLPYEEWVEPYKEVKINDGSITMDKLSDEIKSAIGVKSFNSFTAESELTQGEVLTLATVHIGKNSVETAHIEGALTKISVGVGYSDNTEYLNRGYASCWVEIDQTSIRQYCSYNNTEEYTLIDEKAHGLTITNSTVIEINNLVENAKLRVYNDIGDSYEQDIQVGVGTPFVINEGANSITVKLSFMPLELNRSIWAFGDSYFNFTANSRWPYYFEQNGYTNWLSDNQPGLSPVNALTDLENLLLLGARPKYILWCLGMNGPTSENTDSDGNYIINSTQKAVIDSVVDLCKTNNITLVLATIPTVPTRQKTGFNNYVRSIGVKYIDFEKAVGTDSSGEWNEGLLSTDGVHPTSAGAKVLASRVLADFPELCII